MESGSLRGRKDRHKWHCESDTTGAKVRFRLHGRHPENGKRDEEYLEPMQYGVRSEGVRCNGDGIYKELRRGRLRVSSFLVRGPTCCSIRPWVALPESSTSSFERSRSISSNVQSAHAGSGRGVVCWCSPLV